METQINWVMNKYLKIVPKIYGCLLYTTVAQKTSADSRLPVAKANTQLSNMIISQLSRFMVTNVMLTVLLLS